MDCPAPGLWRAAAARTGTSRTPYTCCAWCVGGHHAVAPIQGDRSFFYRDPHVGTTLRAFVSAADALRSNGSGGDSAAAVARLAGDCDEAIVSTIGALDVPPMGCAVGGGSAKRDPRTR